MLCFYYCFALLLLPPPLLPLHHVDKPGWEGGCYTLITRLTHERLVCVTVPRQPSTCSTHSAPAQASIQEHCHAYTTTHDRHSYAPTLACTHFTAVMLCCICLIAFALPYIRSATANVTRLAALDRCKSRTTPHNTLPPSVQRC